MEFNTFGDGSSFENNIGNEQLDNTSGSSIDIGDDYLTPQSGDVQMTGPTERDPYMGRVSEDEGHIPFMANTESGLQKGEPQVPTSQHYTTLKKDFMQPEQDRYESEDYSTNLGHSNTAFELPADGYLTVLGQEKGTYNSKRPFTRENTYLKDVSGYEGVLLTRYYKSDLSKDGYAELESNFGGTAKIGGTTSADTDDTG